MTVKSWIGMLIGVLSLLILAVCIGCVKQRTAALQAAEPAQPEKAVPEKAVPPPAPEQPASVYDVKVKPLTTRECAQCHMDQFTRIRKDGGKHVGVACTDCHEVYHAYNPLKNNYAEIMPKCSACHDNPHGKDKAVQKCADCHADPHRPVAAIPDPSNMEMQCRICHTQVAQSLTKHPSKHTEEDCSSCHSQKHGRIPECSECHENHSPMVTMSTPECLACHPVHTPLQIAYSEGIENNPVCAGCHDVPYEDLKTHQTKHSELACAECHPAHKELMACQDCHGDTPHNPAIHKKYPKCGDCHNIAHDLRM